MVERKKAERLLNLTIALLSARGFLTKHEIRERIEGYAGLSDAAFERSFERDKDDLRASGISIQVGRNRDWGHDEPGYRILRSEFELPPIELTAEEAAVVSVASRAWPQAELAASTVTAVHKLAPDATEATNSLPWDALVTVPERVFRTFVDAISTQSAVRFDYRNSRGVTRRREIEPWGMSQSRGSWYVTGGDRSLGERRTFKLDRVAGKPTLFGGAHAFELPDDFDLRAITRALADQPSEVAVIALRPGTEAALQRRGQPTDHARPAQVPPEWLLIEVAYSYRPGFVGELAAAAGNIIVVGPADLRDEVIERWQAVAAQ